jgi:hypothetical protein
VRNINKVEMSTNIRIKEKEKRRATKKGGGECIHIYVVHKYQYDRSK